MSLVSRASLIARIRRGRLAREQFVESHLAKTISHQVRAIRDRLGWSQEDLAREANMTQNAISRLESASYGKPTLTTLKRLAAALDVALIVRFVPFSELVDWVSETPRTMRGLTNEALAVPSFEIEENGGVLGGLPAQERPRGVEVERETVAAGRPRGAEVALMATSQSFLWGRGRQGEVRLSDFGPPLEGNVPAVPPSAMWQAQMNGLPGAIPRPETQVSQ